MNKVNKDILKQIYPPRLSNCRKYDFGLLLVIGGGDFYTGSPALSAMAALRAGVDMTHIFSPQRSADIIASFSPDLAVFPLKGIWLDKEDLPTILSQTKSAMSVSQGKTAVVIGGGLGRSPETQEVFLDYLEDVLSFEGISQDNHLGAVIDADGLHALSKDISLVKNKKVILTPHSFELSVLSGINVEKLSLEEKIKIVEQQADKIGCVVALKGKTDIISDGKETALNETGNPFMTVGGTGDTLAGLAGAYLAMGFEPFLAAQAACFVNGKAGDLAAKKRGAGMIASDLIDFIGEVIKSY